MRTDGEAVCKRCQRRLSFGQAGYALTVVRPTPFAMHMH